MVIQDLMDDYLQKYATHLRPRVGLSDNLLAFLDRRGMPSTEGGTPEVLGYFLR